MSGTMNEVEPQKDDLIGPFRVIQSCGDGAFANAYYCDDTRLPKRRVLIKWAKSATPEAQTRFQSQAWYEMSVESPYVRKTYEYDVFDGRPVIVHQYVEGVPLRKWLPRQSLGNRLGRFADVLRGMIDLSEVRAPHGDLHAGNAIVNGKKTVLIDLNASDFGGQIELPKSSRAKHDQSSLLEMFKGEFFEKSEREGPLKELARLLEADRKDLDQLLVATLSHQEREALRPGSSHDDVRRAVGKSVGEVTASFERLYGLRLAALTGLLAMFQDAVETIVPAQSLAEPISLMHSLDALRQHAEQQARSHSWSFYAFGATARLRDSRAVGFSLESSRSGFLPPWPSHLLERNRLAEGTINYGDAHFHRNAFRVFSLITEDLNGPPKWYIEKHEEKIVQLDGDEMIEALKPHLVAATPDSWLRDAPLIVAARDALSKSKPKKKSKARATTEPKAATSKTTRKGRAAPVSSPKKPRR